MHFAQLISQERLDIEWSSLFDTEPTWNGPVSNDKLRGMLLGLAIGDALGNTSESLIPVRRSKHHGEIRDYLENWYASGKSVGLPSDDTQMAFWTLESILEHGG